MTDSITVTVVYANLYKVCNVNLRKDGLTWIGLRLIRMQRNSETRSNFPISSMLAITALADLFRIV